MSWRYGPSWDQEDDTDDDSDDQRAARSSAPPSTISSGKFRGKVPPSITNKKFGGKMAPPTTADSEGDSDDNDEETAESEAPVVARPTPQFRGKGYFIPAPNNSISSDDDDDDDDDEEDDDDEKVEIPPPVIRHQPGQFRGKGAALPQRQLMTSANGSSSASEVDDSDDDDSDIETSQKPGNTLESKKVKTEEHPKKVYGAVVEKAKSSKESVKNPGKSEEATTPKKSSEPSSVKSTEKVNSVRDGKLKTQNAVTSTSKSRKEETAKDDKPEVKDTRSTKAPKPFENTKETIENKKVEKEVAPSKDNETSPSQSKPKQQKKDVKEGQAKNTSEVTKSEKKVEDEEEGEEEFIIDEDIDDEKQEEGTKEKGSDVKNSKTTTEIKTSSKATKEISADDIDETKLESDGDTGPEEFIDGDQDEDEAFNGRKPLRRRVSSRASSNSALKRKRELSIQTGRSTSVDRLSVDTESPTNPMKKKKLHKHRMMDRVNEKSKRVLSKDEVAVEILNPITVAITKLKKIPEWLEKKQRKEKDVIEKTSQYLDEIGAFIGGVRLTEDQARVIEKKYLWEYIALSCNYGEGGRELKNLYSLLSSELDTFEHSK